VKFAARFRGALAVLALAVGAAAQDLTALSNADAVAGLKDALIQGAGKAVGQLGATGGFLDNAKVKIPLPPSILRIESGLRMMGMGSQADELVVRMNQAAELAVKEATPVLTGAIQSMSVNDAKGILTGGDDAATRYFQRTTSDELTRRFLPIVKTMTSRVQLAQQYDALAGNAASLGLMKSEDANIDGYVTHKALDGLFLAISEQERAIRSDPAGAATGIARKVFGLLR
jgi:uncharacterized protein DUF4197